ncbi:unnamed protein product [Cylindrotheca closterium]|uniref:Uncharacterized protein n=1 Tax=Cylindrotheca closterium TaxID=2856 RepID=A0AAD2CGB2_9STRA|nr:unnamed protein product [Cylindrotheca closterium]
MSILEQIQANSISQLKISQDADEISSNTGDIIDALRNNTSIESIHFEGEFLGEMRNTSRVAVVEAIGYIPTLRRVHLADALVLVNAVTKMLCNATELRELSIGNLVLQGIESDFSALEGALAAHNCLKLFKMDKCIPAVKDISLEGLTTSSAQLSSISDPVPNQRSATTA